MLNRRHIRIKVMQVLYAAKGSESEDLKPKQNFLIKSFEGIYDLYLAQLLLLIELHTKAEDYIKKSQNKHLATAEEKNPNLKFIKNEVFQHLKQNENLSEQFESRKINLWVEDFEYVDVLFKQVIESELYKSYMANRTSSFKEDKLFVLDLFTEIIAPNDKLYEFYEDKNITWLDDLPVINTGIQKLLKKIKSKTSNKAFVPKLFKEEEDKDFGMELLSKTVLNQSAFNTEIANKTKNWDADRITKIDTVLLQMAICEFQKFPSIPVKVTINEYLEIAKEYSTPKSSNFVNGILDKLVREYKSENRLNKTGRGLM
ncbi:MAG: transcription antitermination factor NusB [Bacteroidota bacterium]